MERPESYNPYSAPKDTGQPLKELRKSGQSRFSRHQQRVGSLIFLFVFAAFLIYRGFGGLEVNSLSAHYVGYLLAASGVLGVFGVNIWIGGPLDKRLDSQFDDK